MTQDELAALDRAATQGVWITETGAGDEWWFGGGADGMETVLRAGNGILNIVAGGADNADLKLAAALVNLYRARRIAVIDDEAVKRVREGTVERFSLVNGKICKDEGGYWMTHDRFRAAIAALGVKP